MLLALNASLDVSVEIVLACKDLPRSNTTRISTRVASHTASDLMMHSSFVSLEILVQVES
jgi:hypothetical protein